MILILFSVSVKFCHFFHMDCVCLLDFLFLGILVFCLNCVFSKTILSCFKASDFYHLIGSGKFTINLYKIHI